MKACVYLVGKIARLEMGLMTTDLNGPPDRGRRRSTLSEPFDRK